MSRRFSLLVDKGKNAGFETLGHMPSLGQSLSGIFRRQYGRGGFLEQSEPAVEMRELDRQVHVLDRGCGSR